MTATVTFDISEVTLEDLQEWIRECGLHCSGYSVPGHICDPKTGNPPNPDAGVHEGHGGHDDHGGDGAAMAAMAADMRNRFVVALVFALIITTHSHIGKEILGLDPPVQFGMSNQVWQLLLSLLVIFWSSSIFFRGAVAALRSRTLDMMVPVAVAVGIGTGWLYSTVVTFTGADSEVFFEAATMLAAFVLLVDWFEMRARGGANDAIRTLLNLAPAMAFVERDGQVVEVPTGDVVVGDRLIIRPGSKVDRGDPGGLAANELLLCRRRPTADWVDTGCSEDLPHSTPRLGRVRRAPASSARSGVRREPQECRKDCAIRVGERGPVDLTPKYEPLMAQSEDLRVPLRHPKPFGA